MLEEFLAPKNNDWPTVILPVTDNLITVREDYTRTFTKLKVNAQVIRPSAGEKALLSALSAGHGLINIGGYDCHPSWYGASIHDVGEHKDVYDQLWDERTFRAMQYASDFSLPELDICRGAQLRAVLQGYSLIPHVPDLPSVKHIGESHSNQPVPKDAKAFRENTILIEKNTPEHALMQCDSVQGACAHHMAVDYDSRFAQMHQSHKAFDHDQKPRQPLRIVGYSQAGVIELFAGTDPKHLVYGFQFHIERGDFSTQAYSALLHNWRDAVYAHANRKKEIWH